MHRKLDVPDFRRQSLRVSFRIKIVPGSFIQAEAADKCVPSEEGNGGLTKTSRGNGACDFDLRKRIAKSANKYSTKWTPLCIVYYKLFTTTSAQLRKKLTQRYFILTTAVFSSKYAI